MKTNRNSIREAVFLRDGYKCVSCGAVAQDAHHLLERRLWHPDDGYTMNNLISVCGGCHLLYESTEYSVEKGRKDAGITEVEVPLHMYADQAYDKWGNPILDNGTRLRGELMNDESVVKALKDHLYLFSDRVKYPRTMHLPWSHPHKDDIAVGVVPYDCYTEVIVTEKMDGENTTMYHDYLHARSIDSASHPSQGWVKNFWANNIAYVLPEGMRVCGENVYARHSLAYNDLETYFYGFGLWDDLTCLSWDDTLEWFSLLGVTPVRELFRGDYGYFLHDRLNLDEDVQEGYVIRPTRSFHYREFPRIVTKYVRKGHIQTKERWSRMVTPNALASG